MSRLLNNITSDYFKAVNSLKSQKAPQTVQIYVENEDDIPFWRDIFERYAPQLPIKISFPSYTLARGKNHILKCQAGKFLLLCVDSDYDYLLQHTTETSRRINTNPYIFQTYTYSIENYKCYAESLKHVCVSTSLNDEELFDIIGFMTLYSSIIYELFLYSYYFEKQGTDTFARDDFSKYIKILEEVNILEQGKTAIENLVESVNDKLEQLKTAHTDIDLDSIAHELNTLGVHQDNTYLFVKGHVIYDNVVLRFLRPLDKALRQQKISELKETSSNETQRKNKRSEYKKSQKVPIDIALKLNTNYHSCVLMKKIKQDIVQYLAKNDVVTCS